MVGSDTTGPPPAERRRRRSVIIVLLLLLVGFGCAVLGTLSTFTTSLSKNQSVSTGTFTFTLTDPAAGAVFATNISGMAPGDFGDRLVDLNNTGSIQFASVDIAVTAPTSSLLDTDATNGLAVQIDKCTVAWTQASAAVAASCGGSVSALTALTPVATLKATGPSYSAGLTSLVSGTDHLRLHYSLPTASTGTSGLTSVLTYTFTATQAAGGAYH